MYSHLMLEITLAGNNLLFLFWFRSSSLELLENSKEAKAQKERLGIGSLQQSIALR